MFITLFTVKNAFLVHIDHQRYAHLFSVVRETLVGTSMVVNTFNSL